MSGFDVHSRRDDLVRRRVQLRRAIERQVQLIQWRSGDAIDNRRRLESLELELRGTEKEYRELEGMLGRPHPVKPVRLSSPVQLRGTATRSAMPGYLTRAMMRSR